MDGLSIAASLIAVIQVTASCLKLSKRWVGSSEFSSADLLEVTSTLSSFNGSIKTFETHIEIFEEDAARLRSLEYLSPVCERCKVAMEVVQDFMNNRGFMGKYLVSPKLDRRLKRSLRTLEEGKELFMLALNSDQQTILLGVERYLRNLAEDQREYNETLGKTLRNMHEIEEETCREIKRARIDHESWGQTIMAATKEIKAFDVDRERQNILDWLTPDNYAPQQNGFINHRQAGTGQWLLDSPEYRAWRVTQGSTLFCQGDPGAGKTMLASIIVDQLTTELFHTGVGIAYIYCNFRRQDEQRVEHLLASLLRQLAESVDILPGCVQELYTRHKPRRTRPQIHDILDVLMSVVATFPRIFIVIDALDESAMSNDDTRLNLLVTSRFIPNIKDRFQDSIFFEIRATDDDLRQYLSAQMYSMPKFVKHNPRLQEDIICRIVAAVGGMFLLAKLHFDSLKGKMSPKAINIALAGLKTGSNAYHQVYTEAMQRINGQLADEALVATRVLSWITCAKRELTTLELQHAIGVEVGGSDFDPENLSLVEDLLSVCAGLVIVDDETNVIRLIHYTTQQYLERTRGKWLSQAHRHLAQTCLTYLSFKPFRIGDFAPETLSLRLRSYPLYDYAARNWGYHASDANELLQETLLFLGNRRLVGASYQALAAAEPHWIRRTSGYGIFQGDGESYHVKTLLYRMKSSSAIRLHLAAYFGLSEAIKVLLQSEMPRKDFCGQTPLMLASANGHKESVTLLLTCVDQWSGSDEETKIGMGINSKNIKGRTAISMAAENGHEEIVQQLLQHGADIYILDVYGQSPVMWAKANGHTSIVEFLATNEDEESEEDVLNPINGLSHAAMNGDDVVVRNFLKETNPNGHGPDGRSPLFCALQNGHYSIMAMLLEHGASVDEKDHIGRTLLSLVAEHGVSVAAKTLIKHNADINSKDHAGRTPLSWAAEYSNASGVKLLVEHKAIIDSRDHAGRTPLSWAAERGSSALASGGEGLTAVEMLLDSGANMNSEDAKGQSPLLYAAWTGTEAIMKLLINSAEAGVLEKHGKYIMYQALRRGNVEVFAFLLSKEVILDAGNDDELAEFLSEAASSEHIAVVQHLLHYVKSCLAKDDKFATKSLVHAASHGNQILVEQLLEIGANVEAFARYRCEIFPTGLRRYYVNNARIYVKARYAELFKSADKTR